MISSNCIQFTLGIECYHRAIKQLCGIERFMVRTTDALKTHFFCAIRAFTQLELMRSEQLIENWYELQRNLSLQVAREFMKGTPQTENGAECILEAYCQCVSPKAFFITLSTGEPWPER